MQNRYEKMVLAVLVLLALINLVFFIVTSYSGPIWGFVVTAVVSILWWKKRNAKLIMIVAIVWMLIHIIEFIVLGPSAFPILFYLNLLLPIPLFYYSLKTYILMKSKMEGEG